MTNDVLEIDANELMQLKIHDPDEYDKWRSTICRVNVKSWKEVRNQSFLIDSKIKYFLTGSGLKILRVHERYACYIEDNCVLVYYFRLRKDGSYIENFYIHNIK